MYAARLSLLNFHYSVIILERFVFHLKDTPDKEEQSLIKIVRAMNVSKGWKLILKIMIFKSTAKKFI